MHIRPSMMRLLCMGKKQMLSLALLLVTFSRRRLPGLLLTMFLP